MPNEFKKVALEWLKKADNDLGFARAGFAAFDEFYSQMCILCHDAAEKYLKAYLVFSKKVPPRTHDLELLLGRCEKIARGFEAHLDECKILNRYYAPLKYPSHYPECTRQQAREAIGAAESISKFVREKLS